MKFLNKIIFSFLLLLLFNISFSDAEGIYINNNKIQNSTPVLIQNDKAFIAAGDLSVAIGGSISWNKDSKTATIKTDTLKIEFTNGSNIVKLNDNKVSIELKPVLKNGKLMIPATVLRDFLNFKISWNYKTKNFLINSDEKSIVNTIKFSQKNDTAKLEKTIGSDSEKFSFTYALTDDVKNEKYLVDGKYFIFKAGEKGNVTKGLNGYFYMNVYTFDVYYYPLDSTNDGNGIKKYSNGKEVSDFNKNGRNTIHSLIATTHMINDIKESDNSLANFTYTRKDNINKEYLKHIPKATYYYYQASKKENNALKPQFEIAQNASTLDVYIFLKKENGVNIVQLPDKLIKTINVNKKD
ncbi:MAG: copper amine oxidase N-terminal domain-containing protein [Peptoanaerobacter stomatis]